MYAPGAQGEGELEVIVPQNTANTNAGSGYQQRWATKICSLGIAKKLL